MTRKLIWTGIVLGLIPLYMGAACGGYFGWPGLTTSGSDAKITEELSVSGTPLQSGLWTYYASYNNTTGQHMKSVSTYRDGSAPFGLFTSDGNLEQHFNDHVGVITSAAFDANGDGIIDFTDYPLLDGFCPSEGGTGSTSASSGFKAYCNKGDWAALVASSFTEETKQSVPGSKYSNAIANNFSPIAIAQIIASSTLINKTNGLVVTINSVSLPSGASYTLTTPITLNAYGMGHALAIDAAQPGVKELAGWLAGQFAGQQDGKVSVSLSFNGGAATLAFPISGGNSASIVLQHFAGS